jgi:SAM-dependent methyltransferase
VFTAAASGLLPLEPWQAVASVAKRSARLMLRTVSQDPDMDAHTPARFRRIDALQIDATQGARRTLELGAGSGRLLAQLGGELVVGVDVDAAALGRAAARGLTVLRADAHDLPFADGSFDAIAAGNAVFRHLDYPRALRECWRVLAAGGRLAFHQYADDVRSWRGRLESVPRPPRSWHVRSVADLVDPARSLGFTVVTVQTWRSVRFPPYAVRVPAVGRWWNHICVLLRKP